jgi:hypothetical protein
MHTRTVTYSDSYQHASNREITFTPAGLMIDALGLAAVHGDREDHYAEIAAEFGEPVPEFEQRRLDETLAEIHELGAEAVR